MSPGWGVPLWVWAMTATTLLTTSSSGRRGLETSHPQLNFTFTRPAYRVTIPENSVGKTYAVAEEKMGMFLPPRGEVQFKIVSGDSDKIFKAEERVVGNFLFLLIRTRTGNSVVLNRERKDTFVLSIKATLTLDDRIVENSTIVTLSVSDRNDLRPLFYQTSYQVTVVEDERVHSSIIQIRAEDADLGRGGEIYYRLREPSSNFVIHPVTGVVTLTRPLRYAERRSYDLTVLAQDRGDIAHTNPPSAAKLTVVVKQVNLYNPEIFVKHFQEVYETSDTNVYAIVTVVDKDIGRNGEIDRLEIFDGDSNGHFRIKRVQSSNNNTFEYNIITYRILNRERYSKRYNLTLKAVDKGTPPRHSFLSVNVNVEAVFQKIPIFEKEIFEIDIMESAPINSPIIRLKITENDQIYHNEVHVEIVGGNEEGVFRINPQTGMLYTADNLDAEEKNLYILTVSAIEQGKAGFSMQSSAKVKINIVDINDNDPIFEVPTMNISVTENEPPGTVIAKVVAKDRDSGENGYISYSIANLNPVPFEIDHFTGVIKTIETLDYETMRRESLLYVRASDWGLPFRRQTEMELRVKLRDINDNKPQFERVNCSGSLSRYAPIGSEVMSLTAIDFDSGNIISYRIVSKNTEGCFNLDLTSGILSVACDLRFENFTQRTLNTTATDGLHYSDINQIHIRIVNDMPVHDSHFDNDNFQCKHTGVAKQLKDVLAVAAKSNMAKSPDHRDISIMPKRYGENIHAPEILNLPATVQVNESVPLGNKIIKIQAKDRDLGYNGKLVYGVISGDNDSLFRLDPENGILKTVGHLDYEKDTEYNLNIVVFDLGRPQKSSTSYLTVVVLDNNDNPPKFQQPMASIKISENTPNGTAIFKAIATDIDSTENAQIVYSLVTETDVFIVHPTTGVLYVNSPPDREKSDTYEIRIRASDHGNMKHSLNALHAESVVLIYIDDVNDNAPKFVKESLAVKVKEDMPVGSVVAIMEAIDEDLGVNSEVVYSMEGNHSLAVDPFSGALRLTRPLDYEEKQRHDVNVTACDRGSPPLCASAVVVVNVVDVDENSHAPQFPDWAVSATVSENQPPGVTVTTVKASDDDPPGEDSRVSYHIAGGDGVGYFSIDDDGVIRTTSSLDAETENHFWLTVFAQDHGLVPLRSRLEVYVTVKNVNDNVPLTTEPVYYPHILENSPANTPVLHITAEDADLDPTQTLTFNITSGNQDGFFQIDHQTGLLSTTRNKIDREYQAEHDIEITVSDNGNPPLSSTTRLVVVVDDVNDNAPQFEQSFYHVIVPQTSRHKQTMFQIEDDSNIESTDTSWDQLHKTAFGEPLIRVLATDKDTGNNADIEYSIKTGRGKGRFSIHPEMGVIYSHKPFSQGQEFELMVKATDHGFPNKSSTARIVIQVVAVPESKGPPFIKQKQQRVEVTESDPVGFLVALIQATDETDYLWFKIVDGNPRGEFVMGGDPGSVLLAKQLDCETQEEYNLTIAVSNGAHTVLTQVLVNVVDMNEHRPEFPQQEWSVNVSEAATVGQVVAKVQGVDADRGGTVVYEFYNAQSPSSLSLFLLDHENGQLTVNGPLDRDHTMEHVITIVAKDGGTPSKRNFARLRIAVEDTNNHAPQWSNRLIQGFVLESAERGATVLQLLASDQDHGENAQIRYSILSGNIGNTFSVHPNLGTLTLAGSVDGSRLSEYMLTVQATDSGSPPLSSTIPVHILVIMADETVPRFTKRSFTVQIYENERAGSLVEHLDVRASSSVFFEITEGNENNVFTINPSTGSVTTLLPLDREHTDFYNLTVAATNSAGAKAECNLLVNVLDKNDNAPQLLITTYAGFVLEDVPVGSLIQANNSSPLVIYAFDADTQSNALLRFKILEPLASRMFYIDGFTGTIRTKTQLDYETMSSVILTVRVFDLGEPQLTSDVTARVYITVLDVNDCMPRFLQTEYNLSLLVPSYPDARLLQVEAVDDDTAAVTELRYMILTGNKDSWFILHPETGLLSVRGLLPFHRPLEDGHSLRLAVSDGHYSAHARVNIRWLDGTSSQLQFQHPVYQGYVTENSTKPVTVAVVSVVGEELNQHIRFRMANPTPLFHLGLTSGALVTTGVPFDREDKDLFTIYIQAEYEDSEDTRQQIQTLVNISVVDVNDNCPVFMNTPYVAAVSVGAYKHVPFFKVSAIDLDEGENGDVRYELTRGHGELFKVDRKTGEISLKQALQATLEAYIIIITAYDGGVTPCSTEASLVVNVVAESSPRFERQLYTVTVPESLPPHSLLPLGLAAESTFGHPITYAVLDHANLFSVDVTAGALFTEDTLDYEATPALEVRVRATDSLSGEAAEALVTVVLTDVNDNVPTFPQAAYNISLLESTPVGSLIAVIKAEDNDTGVNGAVQYSVSPPLGVVRVDPRDGSLLLQQPLDREVNSTFHLILTAADSGLPKLSSIADIWLHALDVNDNPPKFERPTYNCKLSEESTAGQFVTAVHAKDPDIGPLTYLIVGGNDHHTFRIHPQSGIISVFNTVHLARPEPHMLNVSVTDGVHTSFCRVSVHVLLTNRHAPVFSASQHEATVAENQSAGFYVTTVTATDLDPGSHGKVTYSIPTELMRSFFHINPDTGKILTEKALDRERQAMMEVPVVATDGAGRSDFTTVRVAVSDLNDNAPEFHYTEYRACIPANLSADSVFLKVKARDKDAGAAGLVEYSIYNLQSKRVKHLFGINPQTGSIVLLQSLSQYESQPFQFFVRASDGGVPPLFSDVEVNVYVMRPGDTPPTFHRRDQHVFVSEDAAPGTVVTQVKLVTPMTVEYKLVAESSPFSIDNEGVVKLTAALDRETAATHTLGVLALRPPLSGFTEVHVSVVDVNDNPPRFHSAAYNVRVAENVPEGTSIIRVSADDQDEGSAGEVRYSISSVVLTVDPYSGWVSVVSGLDRETAPRHSVLLTATDNGDPPLSSTAVLHLDIADYNDSPPTFSHTEYTASVKEDLAVGGPVVQVSVTDPDGAGLDLYITDGDPDHRFSMRSTGQLYLAQPLDREVLDSYHLTVVVTDSKYVVETGVHINVLDVNDNKPKCLQPQLQTTIPEDIAPGSTVLIVPAEDADLDPQLRYHLAGTNAAHFYFDQITGELKTAVGLDRETVTMYSLVAHVQDRDTPGWGCTSHVTIRLSDVNDNAPVFPKSNYTAAVPEDSAPGSFVTILRAVDSDSGINRRIRYSISSSDGDYFSIDEASGLVQIARPLDKNKYSLTVQAADHGESPLSSAANLHVLVVDVNDNPPEFAARSYHALVSEGAGVGSEVTRLSAISIDDGIRSPVVYSIIAGNEFGKFTIEPHTDRIIVAEPLDYEETRQYLLTVLATDAGEHPLSTHTAVNITVTDKNDNAPQFSQPSYSAEISELASPGHTVIQVSALDADSGKNGAVRYSLVGEKSKEFRLDPASGVIRLAASLDREKVDSYVLRVQARDSGLPTLSSVAVVHVSVTDANDNSPLFLQPNLTAILQEDKPAGWAVCQLVVTDADIFPNAAPFIFEILYDDSGGKFRIDSKGVLQTLTQFSRQSKDTFHLQVRVYDSGSPPLFSDSWITIKVIEESQFPPEVWPLRVTVVSYEDRWAGGELGQVLASDRDPYDSLGFELLPASSLFTIDPHHGVIEASSGLDAGRYLLNVSVTDGKFSRQVAVDVVVQPLWEENLQHAISLRLIGISSERFLLDESQNVVKALETVLLRNASIMSIQKTSSKYLDVLLIIMGGIDLATVEEILQSIGLTNMPPSCKCKNGAKCRQRVTVQPERQTKVQTNSSVFIAPVYSFTLYCACALGYTGELCEDQLPASSDCACSGSQTCLNPPCVAPSCSNNHSCFPPNISSGTAVSSEELVAITATAFAVITAVALFVIYRRCHGEPKQAKQRRGHVKQPGAVDKLDITEISGSYCQHDILAGISLNSLTRPNNQPQTNLDVVAVDEPAVVTTSLQREDDVESYGFPSHRHPTLPDLQTFQVS